MLYHVSDSGGIRLFTPREPKDSYPQLKDQVVWAIDEQHLPNYLLPRECPRVCFYATSKSSSQDAQRFLGPARPGHVVAIDTVWFEKASKETIWIYEFSGAGFEVLDPGAGYFVSRSAVEPLSCWKTEKPLLELLRHRVELRVVPDLRSLQSAVIKSTLQFSCIRMKNLAAGTSGPSEAP